MDNYEIRVLSSKQTDSPHDRHAAIRQALAIANAAPVIIEVWCGSKCVYAGRLGEIRHSDQA
jgi:UDP-N-acetylmuramyl tripeptide synthase